MNLRHPPDRSAGTSAASPAATARSTAPRQIPTHRPDRTRPALAGSAFPRATGQQGDDYQVTPRCASDASISRRSTPASGVRPDHGISSALQHAHRMSS
jgi:hypothetical protein